MDLIVAALTFSGCVRTSGLKNFDRFGDANWRAEDDATLDEKAKGASYLISEGSYKDY